MEIKNYYNFMKIFIIVSLGFLLPACATLIYEENVERCAERLLQKAPEVRYVDGKFKEIADFCQSLYKTDKKY